MSLKPGLFTGLNVGLKTSLLTKYGGALPSDIDGILASDDPMQVLIDMMGFGTKPSYMWGGNEAVGATEIGGSGFNLTAVSTPLNEQTSSTLGAGNFKVHDTASDAFANTTDGALQPGTGSFAALWIGNFVDIAGTRYFFGDRDATAGWAMYRQSAGQVVWYIQTTSGALALTVTGHAFNEYQVIMGVRDMTDLEGDLWTGQGTNNNTGQFDESCSSPTQKLAVGDTNAGSSANMEWGIGAIWLGAAAETLTPTHRTNLATLLGAD